MSESRRVGSKERERERERSDCPKSISEREKERYGTHSKRGNEGRANVVTGQSGEEVFVLFASPFPSFPRFRLTCSPSFRFYFLVFFFLPFAGHVLLSLSLSLSVSMEYESILFMVYCRRRRSKRRLRMRLLKGEVSHSTCVRYCISLGTAGKRPSSWLAY